MACPPVSGPINALLTRADWVHRPEPGEDGYTGFERGSARLELAFLARDNTGVIYTPLAVGRGHWPPESFGRDRARLGDVNARVVGLASLIKDKSGHVRIHGSRQGPRRR
jgi:hypothetical protein